MYKLNERVDLLIMKKIIFSMLIAACLMSPSVYADEYQRFTFDNAEITTSGSVTYNSGTIGNAAYFSNNAYATLNEGVVSSLNDFTISIWVKPSSVVTWSRIFDFGTGTDKYMFLTPSNGEKTVFAITSGGAGSEQKITADIPFSAEKWTHIAITKSGNTAIMYADGEEIGRNESMTISPSDLGVATQNYIAKSQYNDPYFTGGIDDLRIYDYALGAEDISQLALGESGAITSLKAVDISVEANSDITLPDYVTATFADKSTRDVKVKWDSYDDNKLTQDGSFAVEGTVNGTDIKATANIIVTSLSVTDGLTATAQIYADSGNVYSKYKVNCTSPINDAVLMLAVYNGGKLDKVATEKIDSLTSGEYTVSTGFTETDDTIVKSYLWIKEMTPLTKIAERNYGNPYGSSFEVSEVKLTDGMFKTSQDLGKSFIMSLDVDRLLAPVAYSTGATTDKSLYYGGWEAFDYRVYHGTGISGHSLGHWMSAASTMYAATGDEAVKEKLNYAVSKLSEYQNDDGYIGGVEKSGLVNAFKNGMNVSGFDLSGYWVPWYSFHKIYQGLIDAYTLTGNDEALCVVRKFADWAISVTSHMSDDTFNDMLRCEYGGMNEVFAQLYDITNEKKYLDMAVRFSQPAILDPLANGVDELQGKHANTQIPKVIGAAAVYNEDESYDKYKKVAEFFYNTVIDHRSYVIGGNSNREHFGGLTEEVLGTQTCETCNTYNMMKLSEYLYAWEHKPEYMDYYEKALFNHILASQDPETGMKTYFMATTQGHFKVYSTKEDSFWCCVGSGMENPGRYTRNIYYKDGSDFYVNQFISSNVNWKEKGLKISQTTNYPYEDTTVISIDEGSAEASIKLRIPSWIADDAVVTINDDAPVNVSETGYYTINRIWKKGDKITLKLPMGLSTYTARDSANKVAFMYGPVVLAGALGTDNFPVSDIVSDHTSLDNTQTITVPNIVVADKSPETFITPSDIGKLEFTMTFKPSADAESTQEIKLIPYFDLHHQRYSLYWMLYGENEEIETDAFTKALNAVTVDTVYPNEQQPEVDHNMQKNNSYSGYFDTVARGWRDARGADGYFSYDMKVKSDSEKNYVMAVYWGSDTGFSADGINYTREFNILVDGTIIGEQKLDNTSPNKLIYGYYEIPSELLEGKEKVTVKFAPKGAANAAGGVFETRITTAEVKPE